MLEVRDLHVAYRSERGLVRAVDGASFTLEAGEALGLVGESGSGKSSLALALMRMLPRNAEPLWGSVRLSGKDVPEPLYGWDEEEEDEHGEQEEERAGDLGPIGPEEVLGLSEEEFRRRFRGNVISMAFQGAMNSLNPVLRVGHQVTEALLLDRGVGRRGAHRKVVGLFEMVGLAPEVFQRYPHELSGGMKQRVVIAMALIRDPKLVILDEPTSALDVSVQAQIMNLLKRLKRDLGLSLIFITHDIALASDVCDRLAVVYAGQTMELGGIEDVLIRPAHPYTERLLASIPRLHASARPEFIPGAPPDLADPPSGCRFHPRCPYAFDRCSAEAPPSFEVRAGHVARCWLREPGQAELPS